MTYRNGLRHIRLCGAILVILSITQPSRSETPQTESTSEKDQLFPIKSRSPNRPEIETLFAAVDPTQDRWIGEVVNEQVDERLHDLGDAIRERSAEKIISLLHPKLRTPGLQAVGMDVVGSSPNVEIVRTRYDSHTDVGPTELARSLLAWTSDFRSFDVMKFKVVQVEVTSPDAEVAQAITRVLYEMTGRDQNEKLLAVRGFWRMEWSSWEGSWALRKIGLEPSTLARSPAPFFIDVSASALGKSPSYWEQMRLGINHFRNSMDAASGIDVYGHNGVAVGDIDGDGLEDLFVAQPQGLPNRLFRNLGDGTFTDVSQEAGLDLLERTSMGLFGDYENDGDQDLFVILQNWKPVLYVNDGHGKFELSRRAQFERKDGVKATLASASLADYDNDGFLDLYVACYRYFDAPGEDTELALPVPYHDATNGPPNVLFRNQGDGTFEDVTEEAGLSVGNDRFSFSSSWDDYDRDGWVDLYVANDFGRNNLYRNSGDGTFREVTRTAGVEDIGAGMSVAWSDYDQDGWDDLYVGNMWSSAGQRLTQQPGYQSQSVLESYVRHAKGNSLFRNLGDGRFEEVSGKAGVEFGRWAWSSDFFDCDNDGDEDLYVANGFISNTSSKDL